MSMVFIFFLVSALAFAAFASAQNFVLTKETASLKTCPGSTLLVKTNVVSADKASFTVSQSGSASRFTITVPSGFILSAAETKTIFSYVTPPSTTQPGTYTFRINVNSGAVSKNVDYPIIVEDCRKASLQIEKEKQICPGELATFKAILKNLGRFAEDYNIAIQGPAKDWATLSDSFIKLDPGQEKDFFVYIKPPEDKTGKFDFTLTASSATRAFTSSTSTLEILPCYDYELRAEKALYSLCESGKLNVPLTLQNKGTVTNTYKLSLNAPNFVTLEKTLISLAPDQVTTVNLILSPGFGIQGDFPVKVTIKNELGKITKLLPLTVRVEKCYDVQTNIMAETATVCNTFTSQKQVLIKNTGRFDNTFNFALEGATFASLDKTSVTLAPGAEESATLTINPPEKTPARTYNIKVTATDPISKASSSDTIKVSTLTKEQCFQPSIVAAQKNIEVAKDSAAAVSFTIENKGLEKASYILELSGNALAFTQVNPSSLTLEPSKTETVYVHIAPSTAVAEGEYHVGLTARVKDSQILSSETIGIKVLPPAKVPIIMPGQEQKTPWQKIEDFFKNLFKVAIKTNITKQIEVTEEVNLTEEVKQQEQEKAETNVTEQSEQPATKNIFDVIKSFYYKIKSLATKKTEEPGNNTSDNLTKTTEQQEQEKETQKTQEQGQKTAPTTKQTQEQEQTQEQLEEQTQEQLEEQTQEQKQTKAEAEPLITSKSVKQFVKDYAYHLVAALILVIIIIIIATGYWKKIVDFFVEEEEVKTNKINKNKG